MMKSTNLFIGINDTDCGGKRGTEEFSRKLGHEIETNGLGLISAISKHQLSVNSNNEFTSGNSAVCIEMLSCVPTENVIVFLREFVKKHSTKNSSTGFCVATSDNITKKVTEFGRNAKKKKMTTDMAYAVASESDIHIEGIAGNSVGIIGALAAIGLRSTGDDGLLIWVKGHELNRMSGIFHAGEIYCNTRVDCIKTTEGFRIPVNATVEWRNEARPVLMENFITLLVEEHPEKEKCDWRVVEEL